MLLSPAALFPSLPPRDISEDLGAIRLTKGFLLHLSGRDMFWAPISLNPFHFGVPRYSPGDELLMKHSNIMGHCVVKAVTHKYDLLDNAIALGRAAFFLSLSPLPPLLTSHRQTAPDIFCTLNIGRANGKYYKISRLDLSIEHFKEAV